MSKIYWAARGFIKTKSKKNDSLVLTPSINDLAFCAMSFAPLFLRPFSGPHKEIRSLLPTKKQLLTSYQPETLPAKRARRKAETQQSCCQVSNYYSYFPPYFSFHFSILRQQRRAEPVQQKQKTGRRKCDECPAANVVPQEVAVDQIESQQAQERNRRSQGFFPPGDHHSDYYADWKEKKSGPFIGRNLSWMKSLTHEKQNQQSYAGNASSSC